MLNRKIIVKYARDLNHTILTNNTSRRDEIVAEVNSLGGFNICDLYRRTILMECINISASIFVLDFLILTSTFNINLNAQDTYGRSAIHFAAAKKDPSLTEHLLKQPGINYNAREPEGKTALMEACYCGNEETVKLLLRQKNIDVFAETENGKTALTFARYNGNTRIIDAVDFRMRVIKFQEITAHAGDKRCLDDDSLSAISTTDDPISSRETKHNIENIQPQPSSTESRKRVRSSTFAKLATTEALLSFSR